MPIRRYSLAEARKLIAARIEADLQAFTETEWLLSVMHAIPDFTQRRDHHLDEDELARLEQEVRSRIADR